MLSSFCKTKYFWLFNSVKNFLVFFNYRKKSIIAKLIFKLFLIVNNIILNCLPYAIILVIWQIAVIYLAIPNYILPTPITIFKYIISYNYREILLINSSVTALEAFFGLILATLASISLGVIALYNLFFIKVFYKMLLLIQIIPLMAIAPLIIIWFGFGINTKILVVFIICLFPCLFSFIRGNLNIDKELLTLLKSMGASRLQIFRLVILPSSCYSLFSGLKIAVTYSVTGAVIAEYMGAEKGLGVYLARAISSFDTTSLFVNVFCIVFITLFFYKIISFIEKLITPWNNKQKELSNDCL